MGDEEGSQLVVGLGLELVYLRVERFRVAMLSFIFQYIRDLAFTWMFD